MKINRELLKGSTVTLILSLLDRKEMYGYEMIKAIEDQTGGLFTFKEGTLYPILHTLESEGWVNAFWVGEEGSRKRKYYRITDAGRKELKVKKKEWLIFRQGVERVLGVGEI